MQIIEKEKFLGAKSESEPNNEKLKTLDDLTESEFNKLMVDMENPVKAQKQLAVQIKLFLDQRIAFELKTKHFLSDYIRRWVESYNKLLDKLQKSLYGDKSVNLHILKVTHSQLAMRMREVTEEDAYGKKQRKKEAV